MKKHPTTTIPTDELLAQCKSVLAGYLSQCPGHVEVVKIKDQIKRLEDKMRREEAK